jgi:hypothetical protein
MECPGNAAHDIAGYQDCLPVDVVSPWNGRSPTAISWSRTPSEKMSDRESTGFPSACSGDM